MKKNIIGGNPSKDLIDSEAWLQKVFEWDGTFWEILESEMCTKKVFHTTVVYKGAIYHVGKHYGYEEGPYAEIWVQLYNR